MKAIVCFLTFLLFVLGCTPGSPPRSREDAGPASRPEEAKEVQSEDSRLILRHDGREWELDLSQVGFDGIDPTTLDRGAFYDWFAGVEKEINRKPRSARFEDRKLVPHKDGLKVDRAVVDRWLDGIHNYVNRPLEVPVQVWKPRITTGILKRIKEKRLGSYTTVYNPNNWNRTHNIKLSVKAIDHQVVPVGEIFSFNRTVGIRTTARGYRPAKVIVQGEYTEGIGGGICQTSSTLFNSVERAGLRIIQRVSHSKRVTYVPVGRDATVSWGGPDFQFQNQLNRPILLSATAKNGALTVEVFGSPNTVHQPKKTKEAPKTLPESESVPSPEKKHPIDEDAKLYRNEPLPSDRIQGAGSHRNPTGEQVETRSPLL
ncbi:vancomycin resistance protein YoaR [Melghirimyces profundicolus]|uniref:Vancomycin resistance protein YoaR n=1 Tax=Melghirimyces profundicolus TaxID=1242148 RepID=A0A2T6C9N9_9BACL|nr:VanW family protein [Melghirimyces profundicolus]PTX65038.1 vancomycin resistance protein YoaR [Melghirimyces profundicolus]